jgi:hypothetical protein
VRLDIAEWSVFPNDPQLLNYGNYKLPVLWISPSGGEVSDGLAFEGLLDLIATARAITIRTSATAKEVRIPKATDVASDLSKWVVPEASMKTAPIAEVPVINPRLRDKFSSPEMTPRCSGEVACITVLLFAV